MTRAAPSDNFDDLTCANCPDEVILNYDGRGTGWSHIYPDGPDAIRNGTKECRTMSKLTDTVLEMVRAERESQEARYGGTNGRLRSGTGPHTAWLLPYTSDGAAKIERELRDDYEDWEEDNGLPTWLHLVREEIAEVFELDDTDPNFVTELVQVAALCVSWAERRLAAKQ